MTCDPCPTLTINRDGKAVCLHCGQLVPAIDYSKQLREQRREESRRERRQRQREADDFAIWTEDSWGTDNLGWEGGGKLGTCTAGWPRRKQPKPPLTQTSGNLTNP